MRTRPIRSRGGTDASSESLPPPRPPRRGRSLATRRAVVDLVRAATLGSYGVTGFAGSGLPDRIGARFGLPPRGIRIGLGDGLSVELDLTVAHGLPIAEVARQVDSAVRYTIRRSLNQEIGHLAIHVNGLRAGPIEALVPGAASSAHASGVAETIRPDDLAASGTDVA